MRSARSAPSAKYIIARAEAAQRRPEGLSQPPRRRALRFAAKSFASGPSEGEGPVRRRIKATSKKFGSRSAKKKKKNVRPKKPQNSGYTMRHNDAKNRALKARNCPIKAKNRAPWRENDAKIVKKTRQTTILVKIVTKPKSRFFSDF